MLIVLVASGTRGDVQPMVALGVALRQAGHAVRVVAGSNFKSWIDSFGLHTHPTVDVEALMRSEIGIRWAESRTTVQQLKYMKQLWLSVKDETIRGLLDGVKGADLILGGFVSEPLLVSVREKFKIPFITVALQPYRATRSGSASLIAPLPRSNSILNLWTGRWIERVTWSISKEVIADLREEIGLGPQTVSGYIRSARTVSAIYAFSRHVVPPPSDVNAITTGYWFLDEPYTPSDDLLRFIEAGDPPVYVGFGSMPSSSPKETVQTICSVARKIKTRVVLVRGWSGSQDYAVPDNVYLLDHAPHHWLFPRVSAAVHHGGAGTTAAAIRAGIPSVAIPHLGDQPYWGRRIYELGIGPKAIPRHQITEEALASRLRMLIHDSGFRKRAEKLGQSIRAEQGVAESLEAIEHCRIHRCSNSNAFIEHVS